MALVSRPETSPALLWTGKVGDASAFRVWGSRAFVRDLSADKLSPRAAPCVFLGFPPDAPGWQFYHPTSRRVLSSQDVTFDESVPFYRLFPYRTAPLPPAPLFLAPGPPPVDPLSPQGPAPSGVSQVDVVEPVEVAVDSGAARGAEPEGAGSRGAEPRGAEPRGAGSGGAESGGAEPGGAEPGGAEAGGAESARVASRGASSRRELLSPQELRKWFARRWSHAAGAGGSPVAHGPGGARTSGIGAAGAGGASATTGVGPAGASGATSTGAAGGVGAGVGSTGASGAAGAGAAGGVGAGVCPAGGLAVTAGSPGATGTGAAGVGAVRAGGAAATGAATGGTGAVPVGSGGPMRPTPYFVPLLEQVLGIPPSPGPAPPLECPQPVPSQSPLQPVSPLPAPSPYASPTGGLAERREPASRPASPVSTTRPSRRASRLRPSATAMDAEMASWKSTGTYVDEVPPPGANIVTGMWNFRVKRPPGSPPVFKARYVARGFSQRQGVDYFQTFSPTLKMTTLRVLLHEEIWLRRPPGFTGLFPPVARHTEDYTCGSWVCSFYYRPVAVSTHRHLFAAVLHPRSHMVQQVLQSFDFTYSSPQATPLSTRHSLSALPSDESVEPSGPYPELVGCLMYLMTCTRPDLAYPLSILARYVAPGRHRPEHMAAAKRVLRYLCSTSGLGLVLGGRRPVVLTGHADASWANDQATQRSSQGYTFSLGSGSVSWRSTRSSSVLGSSCEAEIYAGAMAAQELRWLNYLLTDLGELPRSPPVLYVDNKAMLALCRKHRLEHRTKHIAVRYFLARFPT
ncbi:unnamed protein product, partial [Closterium sp. NIES-54]